MRFLAITLSSLALICAAQAEPAKRSEQGLTLLSQATDFSAAKRTKRAIEGRAVSRYEHGPGTIACTRGGCRTVPPGCHAVVERTVDDSPSGFQIIVC